MTWKKQAKKVSLSVYSANGKRQEESYLNGIVVMVNILKVERCSKSYAVK